MKLKIAILDSGVRSDHPMLKDAQCSCVVLKMNSGEKKGIVEKHECGDSVGHGTAVYNIIYQMAPFAEITMFRIFDENMEISSTDLALFLEYVKNYDHFDIINLSLGVVLCENVVDLYEICDRITKEKTIIVSAFDNNGAVSFPAAFDNVIGVDASLKYNKIHQYSYVEDSIVNIIGKGTIQKVAWTNPDYIVAQGSSFACAYITGIIAGIMENGIKDNNLIKKELKCRAEKTIYSLHENKVNKLPFEIKNAVLFPFNKEMHAIIRFQKMLGFKINAVYDIPKSGKVGTTVAKILNTKEIPTNFTIENIKNIDMNKFDTLILGHTDEVVDLLGNQNYINDLVQDILSNGKQIYAFDEQYGKYQNVFSPRIDEKDVSQNQFGKLYQVPKPILGIVGTSSKQGKFTLQLTLRQRFIEDGYKVGQLGTEPTALLFGMDEVFPCGYRSSAHVYNEKILQYINEKMWNISQKQNDIIIVGSQASVLSYAPFNIKTYPLVHQQFLQATAADGLIICVNSFDELDFVKSCINTAEALTKGKVFSIVCFPMKYKENWAGGLGAKEHISDEEIRILKERYREKFKLPLHILDDKREMEEVYQECLSFFGVNDSMDI